MTLNIIEENKIWLTFVDLSTSKFQSPTIYATILKIARLEIFHENLLNVSSVCTDNIYNKHMSYDWIWANINFEDTEWKQYLFIWQISQCWDDFVKCFPDVYLHTTRLNLQAMLICKYNTFDFELILNDALWRINFTQLTTFLLVFEFHFTFNFY